MTAIECGGLRKTFEGGKVTALDGLDLSVESGSVFGFLGPNGAGKTTAIRILTGLIERTAGSARVAGEEVSVRSLGLRRRIGWLDQDPLYYKWMSGRELLVFVGELFGQSRAGARRRADELLSMSGLQAAAKRRIGGYSGGMIQRLGIAQALMNRPEVLFLDEPCAALDPIGRREVLEFIAGLRKETTVFMSTHILADVERVCDTVAIVHRGSLLATDGTEELRRRYAPPVLEFEMENAEEARRLRGHAASLPQASSPRPQASSPRPQAGPAGSWTLRGEGPTVRVEADDIPAARARILKIIVEHDLALRRMEVRSASLEDVFVKLVGGAS